MLTFEVECQYMELLACQQIPQNQDENWMWCFSFLLLSNKVKKEKQTTTTTKLRTHIVPVYTVLDQSIIYQNNVFYMTVRETNVVGRALIFSLITYLGLCFSMWFVEESRKHPVSSIFSLEESLVCFEIDLLPDLYCWRWTTVVNCIMLYIQCTRTMYAANQPNVH